MHAKIVNITIKPDKVSLFADLFNDGVVTATFFITQPEIGQMCEPFLNHIHLVHCDVQDIISIYREGSRVYVITQDDYGIFKTVFKFLTPTAAFYLETDKYYLDINACQYMC